MDNKIVDMRQKLLNKFCLNIYKFNSLRESEELKIFLKADVQDVKKELTKLPQEPNFEDLLLKYKTFFVDYPENYDVQAGRHKINEFQNFLKKALLNIRVRKFFEIFCFIFPP